MIQLTRINHTGLVVNSDLIEQIETTPDTVISMTTGQKFMVLESASDIVARIIEFRRSVAGGILRCPLASPDRPAGAVAGERQRHETGD